MPASGAGGGAPAGDESPERRGLGKGLAEIFGRIGHPPLSHVSRRDAPPAPSEHRSPVEEVARAGLSAVQAAVPLDLCAYLHVSEGSGPRLFLSRPSLESLAPTEAFDILTTLKRLLDDGVGGPGGTTTVGRYVGVAVVSRGPWSQGLHVAGRGSVPLSEEERATLGILLTALGEACHAAETAAGAVPGRPARVLVDVAGEEARADVWLPATTGERRGYARAGTPLLAVAMATLESLGLGAVEVVHVTERFVGGVPLTVAVLRPPAGPEVAGAVRRGDDAILAAAQATLEAARQVVDRPGEAATESNRAERDR